MRLRQLFGAVIALGWATPAVASAAAPAGAPSAPAASSPPAASAAGGEVPVDVSGRVRAVTRSARRSEVAAAASRDAERQALIRDVSFAYLDALEADELAAVAAAQVSQAELRRQVAQVRLAAGTVTGL